MTVKFENGTFEEISKEKQEYRKKSS